MTEPENKKAKDYSQFDKMSTEALAELLRLDFQMQEEESDNNAILYIAEVIAKREKEHPAGTYPAPDTNASWEIFKEKYLPYAGDGISLYEDESDAAADGQVKTPVEIARSNAGLPQVKRRTGRRRLRVACAAAVLAALLGGMAITAYATGFDLWNAVVQWTGETFTFLAAPGGNPAKEPGGTAPLNGGEYTDLQTALDAYGITEALAPKWVPERFAVYRVKVYPVPEFSQTAFIANYLYEDSYLTISITMFHDPDYQVNGDWYKDEGDPRVLELNGATFYLMTNAGRPKAVWRTGAFECGIIGDVSMEEMEQILNSIY